MILPDGTKHRSVEDYGPSWSIVRELDQGRFTIETPRTAHTRRVWGLAVGTLYEPGEEVGCDVTWLDEVASRERWVGFGLSDDDF